MKIHSRTVVAALAGAAVVLGLAACGSGDNNTGSPSASGGGETSAPAGGATITYWSMYEETEDMATVMKDVIAKYEADTGNKVKVEWLGREVMTKLQAAMQTNNVPDLVDQANGRVYGSLGATGQAVDLSDVLTTQIPGETDTPADLGVDQYKNITTADGVTYLAPYSPVTYGVFYDGSKGDYSTIKTWDDFTAKLAEVKAATGKGPIAVDGDVPGYTSIWTFSALLAQLGEGNVLKVASDKTGEAWDNDDVRTALNTIASLASDGYFLEGSFGSKFPAVQQRFAQGEATFLYMGSWAPSELKDSVTPGFEFREFPFPTMAAGKNYTQVDPIGLAIPAPSKNVEAAKQFISYLYTKDAQNAIVSKVGNMSIRNDITAPAGLDDLAKALADGPVVNYFDGISTLTNYNTDVFAPLNADLMAGKLSADDFITKIAEAQKLYWEQQD